VHLLEYVENLQTKGELWFTKEAALEALGCTSEALRRSMDRLKEKKRIVVIKEKLVLIIPVEYSDWGIVPADWFIDPLMKLLNIPYYVCLLSAGQMHGAAHQKPMQFQVMTGKDLKDIKYRGLHIRFIYSSKISQIPIQQVHIKSGYLNLATPEATAFDLCKYFQPSGYWSNIATVLAELKEVIDPKKLYDLAVSGVYEIPIIQRLGYLLSLPELEAADLAAELAKVVQSKKVRWTYLYPGRKVKNAVDPVWRLYINTDIEIDDI
jgi:predicted transcriptional regulator of viral defense system